MRKVVLLCGSACVLAGCVAGCGAGATKGNGSAAATAVQPAVAAVAAAQRSAVCPPAGRVLAGVYHPSRLRVLDRCRHAAGRVASVKHEPDGDLHIDLALDPQDRRLLAPGNAAQHGYLVVEFMARDGGHLPAPHTRDRIVLTGAWVDDTLHSWNELHPVWAVSLNGGPTHTSGPQFGGSPAGDRSSNAAADCRTAAGKRCVGYGVGQLASSAGMRGDGAD
jgi:hypothetical protein